jgi:hypothetical protein
MSKCSKRCQGLPFVSIVTASTAIAEFTCAEILRVTGSPRTARRNARDGVFNIMVASDLAADFARWLYQGSTISIPRKRAAGLAMAAWTRPEGMRRREVRMRWTADEDAVVMQLPIEQAADQLGRTVKGAICRRWRLRQRQSRSRLK